MATFEKTFSCPGCCNSLGYQIECSTRVGTASLIGFSAYRSPSIPPKKYRKETYSGTLEAFLYGSEDCTGSSSRYWAEASGEHRYNDAGVLVGSLWLVGRGFPGGVDPGSAGPTFLSAAVIVSQWGRGQGTDQSATSDGVRLVNEDDTYDTCFSGIHASTFPTDSVVKTRLSEEDTEEAAMNRSAAEWGEWGSAFCCTSKTFRGPGEFSFSFQQSKYRIRVKGAKDQLVNIELTFTRTDGDPYTETRQFVAQGSEFIDNWQTFEISASSGQGTCLASSRLYIP